MSELFIILYPDEAKRIKEVYRSHLKVKELTSGSVIKVAYLGLCGHKWEKPLRDLIRTNFSCPYCSNQKILIGLNDVTTFLVGTHFLWANSTPPETVIFTSEKVYEWSCIKCKTFFRKSPAALFKRNVKCPYCNNKKVLIGVNDLATTHPHIAEEWDVEKNFPLLPTQIVAGSGKRVAWKCKLNHKWETAACNRTRQNTQCPYCINKKVFTGFNDVATTHPHLLGEWDYTKNTLSPTTTIANETKVWWVCEKGHEWETQIVLRSKNGQGCPYCSNNKALTGFNDMATTHPHLLEEWDYTKNAILPTEVLPGSEKRIWWICKEKGHEWEAFLYHRASFKNPTFCPSCNTPTSKLEDYLMAYVASIVSPGAILRYSDRSILGTQELDLYLSSYKLAIEFNGVYWHSEKVKSDSNYHYLKWFNCKKKGVQLLQFWEDDWRFKSDLVKKILTSHINPPVETNKIHKITAVSPEAAETFLNQNHIQGFVLGDAYIGAEDLKTGELTAVIVLRIKSDSSGITQLSVLEYCSTEATLTSFREMLIFIEKTFTPTFIEGFSDNMISNGELFKANGFSEVKDIQPDYMYVIQNRRTPKTHYPIERFRTDPNLKYEDGLSERELADLNGLNRIWDAGKTKWEKTLHFLP